MSRTKRLCFFVFLFVLLSVSVSNANVQVTSRVNTSGTILGNEDYVLFGKLIHDVDDGSGSARSPEAFATPVLWRVMSADAAPGAGQKKAILLSHYLLVEKKYNGANNDNRWEQSEIRIWLNDTSNSGFLSGFSASEQAVMLKPSPDGASGLRVTAPAGYDKSGYAGELKDWFGGDNNANNNERKAQFRGAPANFIVGQSDAWDYWTRSEVAVPPPDKAWSVGKDGTLDNSKRVDLSSLGVRAAFFLNLESFIFKSASNDFAPAGSGVGGGLIFNPYILVLPSVVPTGWTTLFASADKMPDGAVINGKAMTVSWDVPISPAVKKWPVSGDFTLSTGEHPTSVTSDDANKKILKLTFATGVTAGANVTLSYNLNTDAVSFDSTLTSADVVNSFANFSVANRTPEAVTPPVDPDPDPTIPPQQSVTDLLNSMNTLLSPDMMIVLLTSTDAITKVPSGSLVMTKKIEPTHALDGYTNLLPSLATTVTLNSGVTGNTLMLAMSLYVANRVSGFENWTSLTDNERVVLLNSLSVVLSYEFASS